MPWPYDAIHHLQEHPDDDTLALAIDVSKAHKRVRLHRDDQGLMLFELAGALYYYLACHFGGALSDYWWKRLAGLITDVCHHLV